MHLPTTPIRPAAPPLAPVVLASLGALLLVLLAAFYGSATARANAHEWRHCRSVPVAIAAGHRKAAQVQAKGVDCRRARHLVRDFYAAPIGSSGGTYVDGFGCAYTGGGSTVVCGPGPSGTDGPERVQWREISGGAVHQPEGRNDKTQYFIPLTGDGSMTLRYTTSATPRWTSAADGPTIFDVVSRMRLTVPVIGPPHGGGARLLVVRLTGVNCYAHCTARTWRFHLGRLDGDGYTRRAMKTPRWGCGDPAITAHLVLRNGKRTTPVTWAPTTVCAE